MSSNPTAVARYAAYVGAETGDFESGMDRVKVGVKDGIKQMAKFAAAGTAGAAGVAAVGTAMDRESNKWRLKAKLGLDPKEAEAAGKMAGDLLADSFGGSLDEVNGAITAVGQNLSNMSKPKEMKDLTQQVLAFSEAFGVDTNESVRGVANMLKTGLAKDSAEAFDILTTGMQNGANRGDDLIDTLDEYSTVFAKLGIDGKGALGLMTQGMEAGARNSDMLADSLKEFAIRSADGSKSSIAAYQALGLSSDEMTAKMAKGGASASDGLRQVLTALKAMSDPVQREATAVALFGTKAEDLQEALYAMDPATAASAKGMEKLAGSSKRAADDIGKATPWIDKMKNKLMGMAGDLGQTGGAAVTALAPGIALFDRFSPSIGTAASAVRGFTFAKLAEGRAWVFSTAATIKDIAVKAVVTTATKGMAAAQWLLNAAMMANPIGLVILGLVALGAIFVLAWKKSETFRKIVTGAWTGVKRVVSSVVGWFKTAIPAMFKWVLDAFLKYTPQGIIIKHWRSILKFIQSIPGKVKDIFKGAGTWLFDAGKKLISGLIKGIKNMIPNIGGAMKDVAGKVRGFFPGSPVKEGPLTSWNNGGAGKRLVGMLADGLSNTRPVESAMSSLSDAASGSFAASIGSGLSPSASLSSSNSRTANAARPNVTNQVTIQVTPGKNHDEMTLARAIRDVVADVLKTDNDIYAGAY